MSRPRLSGTSLRTPGTSAQRLIVGTTRSPFASRPSVIGAPPPKANTRSNSGPESLVAERKSATTLTTPRRFTTSRISSETQRSIWSSGWSSSRARYSFGFADSPVPLIAAEYARATLGDVPGVASGTRGRDRDVRGVRTVDQGRRGTASGAPVVEQVRDLAADPTWGRLVSIAIDHRPEGVPGECGVPRDGVPRGSLPRSDRFTDSDDDQSAEVRPRDARDRDRDDRDAGTQGKVGGTLLEWQEVALVDVDGALGGDGERGAGVEDRLGPADRREEIVLQRAERDRDGGPPHEPVAPAGAQVELLGAVEMQARLAGECGEHHHRIHPAQVVEDVQGGLGQEPIRADDPDPEPGLHQYRRQRPREPVAEPALERGQLAARQAARRELSVDGAMPRRLLTRHQVRRQVRDASKLAGRSDRRVQRSLTHPFPLTPARDYHRRRASQSTNPYAPLRAGPAGSNGLERTIGSYPSPRGALSHVPVRQARNPPLPRRCPARSHRADPEPRQPRHSRDADRGPLPGRLPGRRVRARLLLGRGEDVLGAVRRVDDGRWLPGRLYAQPDLSGGVHGQDRSRRGGPRRVRSRQDELRAAAEGVLGEPRPDPGHAPGQRQRHAVSIRDLRAGRAPARRRRGIEGDVPGAPDRLGLRHDHHGDRRPAPAALLLRRGLPPAIPRQGPERLLPEPRDRRDAPGGLRGYAAPVRRVGRGGGARRLDSARAAGARTTQTRALARAPRRDGVVPPRTPHGSHGRAADGCGPGRG